jgi:FMN-dependent NADH-azoreductase
LVEAYRAAHPDDSVKTIDLFDYELPRFDGPALQAKYRILHGEELTPAEAAAWAEVEAVIAEFAAADTYLFAVPMWNFGIPYALKHYIDVIVQPGYTFSFSPEEGYRGLLTGKRAAVVYARGGAYSEGDTTAFDLQKPYVELVLGFIGVTDLTSAVVEPTMGPEGEQSLAAALAWAQEAGKDLRSKKSD